MSRHNREQWHLFPNGHVEIGTGLYRQPGRIVRVAYRWSPAYSQVTPTGVTMPLNRENWWAMARRDNARCVFHPTNRLTGATMPLVLVKRADGEVAERWQCATLSDAYRTHNGRLLEYRRQNSGHFDSVFTVELVGDDGTVIETDKSRDDFGYLFQPSNRL